MNARQSDKIWVWLISAVKNKTDREILHLLNNKDKTLFRLEIIRGQLSLYLQYKGSIDAYKQSELEYLIEQIKKIKNRDNSIIQIPKIDTNYPKVVDSLNAKKFSNNPEFIHRWNEDVRLIKFIQEFLDDTEIKVDDLRILESSIKQKTHYNNR